MSSNNTSSFITPLVFCLSEDAPKPESFEKDQVIFFLDYEGTELQGKVIEQLCDGTILARIRGLRVPEPYSVGMVIPTTREKVIAW